MAVLEIPKPRALREIEILRVGTHTASNGVKVTFTRADLEEIAASYNPTLLKAALFVTPTKSDEGHAHDTGGVADFDLFNTEYAFGYPSRLEVRGDRLIAIFERIASKFIEAVREGMIIAVSCSVYMPDSKHNPTPGFKYLRHIAALGKSPPAIKGLATLELSEFAIAEFSGWEAGEEGAIAVTIDLAFSEAKNPMGVQSSASPTTTESTEPTSVQSTPTTATPQQQPSPSKQTKAKGQGTGVDFSEPFWGTARPSVLFQKIREYLIAEKDLETAEAVVPENAIAQMRSQEDWQESRANELTMMVNVRDELSSEIGMLNDQLLTMRQHIEGVEKNISHHPVNESTYTPPGMYVASYAEDNKGKEKEEPMGTSSTKELGDRLKTAMSDNDMDAADVAKATGIAEKDLNAVVKGDVAPTQEQMDLLVDLLSLDSDEMSTYVKKGDSANPARKGKVKPPNSDTPELSEEAQQTIAQLQEQVRQSQLEAERARNEAEAVKEQARTNEISSFCEDLIREGKLTVADKGDRVVSFGENEVAELNMVDFMQSLTPPQEAFMREYLSTRSAEIEYSEVATPHDDRVRGTVSFSAAPGYEVSSDRGEEYKAIASFCESHNLDPKNPEDFREGASRYYAAQNGNL